MKRPLIGGKDFKASIGQGEQAQGRSWTLAGNRGVCCVGGRRREENECVRKRLVLMCGRVLFKKRMCARNKHGRISMTKHLEFCFK
jgi:hypothetical protein